jgi:hypothetical protein
MFSAHDHDAHHEHFNYNFGVGGLMDTIFGTHFEGSELQKKLARKKE